MHTLRLTPPDRQHLEATRRTHPGTTATSPEPQGQRRSGVVERTAWPVQGAQSASEESSPAPMGLRRCTFVLSVFTRGGRR